MDSKSNVNKNKSLPVILSICGFSFGTGMGISLGAAFGNVVLGMSIGSAAGALIGVALYLLFSTGNTDKIKS